MAYVVARPRGRFEIRESVHTASGPRARSLANFAHLTDEVMATARRRASRPFDAEAVRSSARKAGSPMAAHRRRRTGDAPSRDEARRFVESSRRMARSLQPRAAPVAARRNPGDTLIELLNFAEQVRPFTPRRVGDGETELPSLTRAAATTEERRGTVSTAAQ